MSSIRARARGFRLITQLVNKETYLCGHVREDLHHPATVFYLGLVRPERPESAVNLITENNNITRNFLITSKQEQLLVNNTSINQGERRAFCLRSNKQEMKAETHRGKVAEHVIRSDVQLVLQTERRGHS